MRDSEWDSSRVRPYSQPQCDVFLCSASKRATPRLASATCPPPATPWPSFLRPPSPTTHHKFETAPCVCDMTGP